MIAILLLALDSAALRQPAQRASAEGSGPEIQVIRRTNVARKEECVSAQHGFPTDEARYVSSYLASAIGGVLFGFANRQQYAGT